MRGNIKKILILPYFGKFNCYFPLWLKSCEQNSRIDWLLVTDNEITESIPNNVKIIKKTFYELKQEFQKKFKFEILLDNPYKLCDYKQFYGYLFKEYIEDYDFWGYCDCDLIFGDIESFLSDEIFFNYDKILRTGHLSFIRNEKKINELFKKYNTHKMVLSSPVIYGYDESIEGYHLGFAGELLENGFRFYQKDKLVADVDFRHFPFHVVTNAERPCVFLYERGKTYRIDRNEKNEIIKTETMYVHLQKRKMQICSDLNTEKFLIVPNEFLQYDENLLRSSEFWERVTSENQYYYDFTKEKREKWKRDIVRFCHEPRKLHSLMFRIKSRGR